MFPDYNTYSPSISSGWDSYVQIKFICWLASRSVIAFVFATVLLLRADSVANIFDGLPEGPSAADSPPDWILPMGIRLIGIYAFVCTLSWTIRSGLSLLPNAPMGIPLGVMEFVTAFAQAAMAAAMTFFPHRVAEFIVAREREPQLLLDALEQQNRE